MGSIKYCIAIVCWIILTVNGNAQEKIYYDVDLKSYFGNGIGYAIGASIFPGEHSELELIFVFATLGSKDEPEGFVQGPCFFNSNNCHNDNLRSITFNYGIVQGFSKDKMSRYHLKAGVSYDNVRKMDLIEYSYPGSPSYNYYDEMYYTLFGLRGSAELERVLSSNVSISFTSNISVNKEMVFYGAGLGLNFGRIN